MKIADFAVVYLSDEEAHEAHEIFERHGVVHGGTFAPYSIPGLVGFWNGVALVSERYRDRPRIPFSPELQLGDGLKITERVDQAVSNWKMSPEYPGR